MIIKVKDLLPEECDIDVVDDYDESLWIAFCGPATLTEEGQRHFANALEVPVEVKLGCDEPATIKVDGLKKAVRQEVSDLFYALAGYCSVKDYEKWIVE